MGHQGRNEIYDTGANNVSNIGGRSNNVASIWNLYRHSEQEVNCKNHSKTNVSNTNVSLTVTDSNSFFGSCEKSSNSSRKQIQSTLVISNSKGLSKILRDIRTSTYPIYRIEEKITRTTTFNKYMCNWALEVRDILKILWKRGERAISPLFHNISLPVVRFSCLGRDQIFTSR